MLLPCVHDLQRQIFVLHMQDHTLHIVPLGLEPDEKTPLLYRIAIPLICKMSDRRILHESSSFYTVRACRRNPPFSGADCIRPYYTGQYKKKRVNLY